MRSVMRQGGLATEGVKGIITHSEIRQEASETEAETLQFTSLQLRSGLDMVCSTVQQLIGESRKIMS